MSAADFPSFILASRSSYKKRLLERLGIPFRAVAPLYREEPLPREKAPDLVRKHAYAKAVSLREEYPEAWILGVDQCAELDQLILGKPGTAEKARAQLRWLSGREHHLWTAVSLLRPKRIKPQNLVEKTTLRMRPLTDIQIARYVERDQPLDCAGSFKIEALGIALFEKISGDDPTAIEGLPLARLSSLLFDQGICVLEF